MQFQITYDDPDTLTKPLSIALAVNYAADTDMLENVCNENNRDPAHLWAARMLGSKSARPFSKSTSERISIAKGLRTSRVSS